MNRAASMLFERAGEYAENPIRPPAVRGLSTGLLDLDDLLFGLGIGLYLVGAVQHVGKTVLLQNIGCNVAAAGGPVLFFSMEHSPEHMFDRILSARTGCWTWRRSAACRWRRRCRLPPRRSSGAPISAHLPQLWKGAGEDGRRKL